MQRGRDGQQHELVMFSRVLSSLQGTSGTYGLLKCLFQAPHSQAREPYSSTPKTVATLESPEPLVVIFRNRSMLRYSDIILINPLWDDDILYNRWHYWGCGPTFVVVNTSSGAGQPGFSFLLCRYWLCGPE